MLTDYEKELLSPAYKGTMGQDMLLLHLEVEKLKEELFRPVRRILNCITKQEEEV